MLMRLRSLSLLSIGLFVGTDDSAPAAEEVEILWGKFGVGHSYAPNLKGRFYASRQPASD